MDGKGEKKKKKSKVPTVTRATRALNCRIVAGMNIGISGVKDGQ